MPIGMLIYRLLFVTSSVCPQHFCNGYLRHGLTQGDKIWQDDRYGWWILAQRLAPEVKKWKKLITHNLQTVCAIRLKFCRMAERRLLHACAKFGTITFDLGWPSGSKVNVKILYSKYLENGDRYDARPQGALICRTQELSIGTVRFDLGWPRGVKNQGHTFWHEICQEGQQLRCWTQRRLYRLLMGFTSDDLERL